MLTPVADKEDESDLRVAVTGNSGPDGLPVTGTAVTIADDDASRPPVFTGNYRVQSAGAAGRA